jgi:hypothetical protein
VNGLAGVDANEFAETCWEGWPKGFDAEGPPRACGCGVPNGFDCATPPNGFVVAGCDGAPKGDGLAGRVPICPFDWAACAKGFGAGAPKGFGFCPNAEGAPKAPPG